MPSRAALDFLTPPPFFIAPTFVFTPDVFGIGVADGGRGRRIGGCTMGGEGFRPGIEGAGVADGGRGLILWFMADSLIKPSSRECGPWLHNRLRGSHYHPWRTS